VIDKLSVILNNMQGLTDFNKLRTKLQEIKDKEDQQALIMEDLQIKLTKQVLKGLQDDTP
jgi:hypothetical protein